MISDEPTARVDAFLDSYRSAFEQLDASAIADHFAYPSHIASDTGEIVLTLIADRQDCVEKMERLLGMYRAIGVSSARILDLSIVEISPRLLQATIGWELHDGAGDVLYRFEASYTLVAAGETLRIAAIAHNEIPRYRACLARLRAGRAAGSGSPDTIAPR